MNYFAERPRASRLRQWQRDMRDAIDDYELKVVDLMDRHLSVPDAVFGMTEDEVADHFDEARHELDAATSFLALAEAEAVLRVDYLDRVRRRGKDPVSRAFRKLYMHNNSKIRLDQDLLPIWVAHRNCQAVVSDFLGAWKLRHWLAHGRYWIPKLGR